MNYGVLKILRVFTFCTLYTVTKLLNGYMKLLFGDD